MFKKAEPKQAKLKVGLYGKQGSGKTLTSLLWAEFLAKLDGKRIAYIDTESGTDFYCQAIPERACHPEAFDFDRIVTRSIMEAAEAAEGLDTSVYGVLVVDSVTHLWEAAREAYTGKRMKNGEIPVHAWGDIKRPYKRLMAAFLNGNYHAIICGREGVQMETDDDGVAQVVGTKMKAEGETPYEPHVLGRMAPEREPDGTYRVAVFFEKDRSGILSGKTFYQPTAEVIHPLMKYLGAVTQGIIESPEVYAARDAAMAEERKLKAEEERQSLFEQIRSAIISAATVDQLKIAWSLTSGKKTKLGDENLELLQTAKDARKQELMNV
jgi:hypothetical protein